MEQERKRFFFDRLIFLPFLLLEGKLQVMAVA